MFRVQTAAFLPPSMLEAASMTSTNNPTQAFHSGTRLLNVVTTLLLVSLGFVLGMICNANFPQSYLPAFLQPLPSLALSSTPQPPTPSPSPSPSPQAPCIRPPLPPPTTAPLPPPPSPEGPRMGFTEFLAPSSGVMHTMTDEELLWRASMAPRVRHMPHRVVPKVAFLFLVRGELPLRPLWEKFFAGHQGLYSIYVHASPDYTGSPPKDSVFYSRMIPSQKTNWGSMNLVEAERRLLANALLDLSNSRFALLSEACIPIFAFPTVYAHLTGSNTSFVDCFDNAGGRSRHRPFFAHHNISLGQWRKGAQWFEMDRALAVEVVSDEAHFPVFLGNHGVGNMEEHYIPTLVSLLGWGRRNANRTVTYADWREHKAHPRSHGARDVTAELIREMRRGFVNCTYNGAAADFCFVFARKFRPDTLAPLLQLAPKVMGFG